eukprot:scaffold90942_cov42-Phaeocystis_antarctica.AAC.1
MSAAPEPLGPARTAAVWEDEDAAGVRVAAGATAGGVAADAGVVGARIEIGESPLALPAPLAASTAPAASTSLTPAAPAATLTPAGDTSPPYAARRARFAAESLRPARSASEEGL